MSYRVNTTEISKATGLLKGAVSALEKAQMRAVNRVASKTRTAASKAIRQQVKLPAQLCEPEPDRDQEGHHYPAGGRHKWP